MVESSVMFALILSKSLTSLLYSAATAFVLTACRIIWWHAWRAQGKKSLASKRNALMNSKSRIWNAFVIKESWIWGKTKKRICGSGTIVATSSGVLSLTATQLWRSRNVVAPQTQCVLLALLSCASNAGMCTKGNVWRTTKSGRKTNKADSRAVPNVIPLLKRTRGAITCNVYSANFTSAGCVWKTSPLKNMPTSEKQTKTKIIKIRWDGLRIVAST